MRNGIRKAVMAVMVNHENKVLIGSSPRDGGYKFPQGGLEPEEDVISGIKRELKEELAVVITDNDIIQTYSEKVCYVYPEDDDYYIYEGQELYVVKVQYNHRMNLIPQDEEFGELFWISPQELASYNTYFRADAYKTALKICGLL